MNPKIAILMSTYNGGHYLEDQIKSIINQTNHDWHLYIRDDGSSDNTTDIIQKYSTEHNNITFINEENINNIGVVASFLSLLKNTNADYYMFCDQDDIWLKDKVEVSLQKMLKEDSSIPLCAFSELKVVNADLKEIRLMNNTNVWFDFIHLLFGNCVTGCTMMINQTLKSKIRITDTDISKIYMHDWWIALFASAFGKLLYIDNPTILYRQHESNVEGSKENTPTRLIKRTFNMKNEESGMISIFTMDKEFRRLFGSQLSGINKDYLNKYTDLFHRSSFTNNLKLIFHYPPKRPHLKGKILFSYLLLFHNKSLLLK